MILVGSSGEGFELKKGVEYVGEEGGLNPQPSMVVDYTRPSSLARPRKGLPWPKKMTSGILMMKFASMS